MFRIGQGYDVHKLTEGRELILCGKKIEYEKGLLGHSDADVAVHALIDALLGAMALGDIGKHFPDSDDKYLGISSITLLKETFELMKAYNMSIGNIDLTIIAQKPKLLPYICEMKKNISKALNCNENLINIKATTTENLGFEGRGEGISAMCVCLLKSEGNN